MTALRGPGGSPSDQDDLVGSSGSAPASADAPEKQSDRLPLPTHRLLAKIDEDIADVIRFIRAHQDAEEAYWQHFREEIEIIREIRAVHPTAPQLAMTAEEITGFYRRMKPGPRTEAQRASDIKIISRVLPGPKSRRSEQDDKYRAFMTECIAAHPNNVGLACNMFVKGFGKRFAPELNKNKKPEKRAKRRQAIEKTAENHWYRLRRGVMK